MRDSNVVMNLSCQKNVHFRSIADSNKKSLNYYLAQIIGEEIQNYNYVKKNDLIDKVRNLGGEVIFEEQMESQTIVINRFKDYMRENNITYLDYVVKTVNYNDYDVVVSAYVFKNLNTGELMFAKIKNKKPTLSYRSRPGNQPQDNVELFMLQLLIDQHLSSLGYQAGFASPYLLFLKSRRDSGDYYGFFEDKPGDNLITSGFFTFEATNRFMSGAKVYDLDEAELLDDAACRTCPFSSICYGKPGLLKLPDSEELDLKDEASKKKVKATPTEAQLEAINIKEGVVRVNAGAGTGKTFVIVNRIIKLIEDGADPKKLLLITFTNKGADEMRQRLLRSRLDADLVNDIVIETFNSFGSNIIEKNYKSFGFKKKPILIDKTEKYKIIINLLQENRKIEGLNYNYPFMSQRYAKGAVVRLSQFFDDFKSKGVKTVNDFYSKGFADNLLSIEKEAIQSGHDFVSKIFYIYLQYRSILKKGDFIDFKDQIMLICDGIDDKSKVLDKMSFSHIIVDEYQDTDLDQLKIVKYFQEKKENESLMVVGDDSQSIYEFRGARPDIMINFHHHFKNVKDVFIVENFRSTDKIVELANKVNELNSERIAKDLYSNDPGEKPRLVEGSLLDLQHIINFDKLQNRSETTAVIGRTNYELADIKKMLDELEIPSIIETPLIENSNVLLFKQILRFLIYGDENVGIFNYLFLYEDGFKDLSLEDKLERMDEYTFEIKSEIPVAYTVFSEDGEMINSDYLKFDFLDLLLKDISDFELDVFYEDLKKDELSIVEIYDLLEEMFLFEDKKTVQSLIDYHGIILTTAHSSKGREFDNVYVLFNEFKPSNSKDMKTINEEVRLLFVAITRAKKELTLVGNKKAYFYDKLEALDNHIVKEDCVVK